MSLGKLEIKGWKCQPESSWTAERPCVLAESAVIKAWVRAKGSNHPLITAWHSARCPATQVVKRSQTMMLPLPCFPAGLRFWYESLTWSSTSSVISHTVLIQVPARQRHFWSIPNQHHYIARRLTSQSVKFCQRLLPHTPLFHRSDAGVQSRTGSTKTTIVPKVRTHDAKWSSLLFKVELALLGLHQLKRGN